MLHTIKAENDILHAHLYTHSQVQQELGCQEWKVESHLSELLLCEEGCYYRQDLKKRHVLGFVTHTSFARKPYKTYTCFFARYERGTAMREGWGDASSNVAHLLL